MRIGCPKHSIVSESEDDEWHSLVAATMKYRGTCANYRGMRIKNQNQITSSTRKMSCCGGHEEQVKFSAHATCGNCGLALSGDGTKCFVCGWIPEKEDSSEPSTEYVKEAEGTTKAKKGKKSHSHSHSAGEECHQHSHAHSGAEKNVGANPAVLAKKPSLLRKLLAFALVVAWLTLVLGRVEMFKLRGKSISIMEPMLESGIRIARPRGYQKQAEAVFQLLGSPATIPDAFHSSKPHMKNFGQFWSSMRTEMEDLSRKWVKDNRLKNAIPSADRALPIASAALFFSLFATLSFPKFGSMMYATAFISMYSVLNTYDQHLKVLDAGWISFAAAVAASFLAPGV